MSTANCSFQTDDIYEDLFKALSEVLDTEINKSIKPIKIEEEKKTSSRQMEDLLQRNPPQLGLTESMKQRGHLRTEYPSPATTRASSKTNTNSKSNEKVSDLLDQIMKNSQKKNNNCQNSRIFPSQQAFVGQRPMGMFPPPMMVPMYYPQQMPAFLPVNMVPMNQTVASSFIPVKKNCSVVQQQQQNLRKNSFTEVIATPQKGEGDVPVPTKKLQKASSKKQKIDQAMLKVVLSIALQKKQAENKIEHIETEMKECKISHKQRTQILYCLDQIDNQFQTIYNVLGNLEDE